MARQSFLSRTSLAGLLVATLACELSAQKQVPAKALPPDLALVGDDNLFLGLEVGRYWRGPEADLLKKVSRAHPVVFSHEALELEKHVGIPPGDVERVVVLTQAKAGASPVVIVTGRKAFDLRKVLAALAPGGKESKVGDRTVQTNTKGDLALSLLNDRTLLGGPPDSVRRLLERKPAPPAALAMTVKVVDSSLMVLAMTPGSLATEAERAGEAGKPFLPLVKAQWWQVTATVEKEVLRLAFRLDFANEEQAKAAAPALEAAVRRLGGYLQLADKEMPAFLKREARKYPDAGDVEQPMKDAIAATGAAVKKFTATPLKNTAKGTLAIQTKSPATTFLMLLSLSPRAKK